MTKKEQIIKLLSENVSVKEIKKQMNIKNAGYIYSIKKQNATPTVPANVS